MGAAEPKETTTQSLPFTQDRAVQKRVAPTIAAVVARATSAPQPTLRPATTRPIVTPKPVTHRTRHREARARLDAPTRDRSDRRADDEPNSTAHSRAFGTRDRRPDDRSVEHRRRCNRRGRGA